MAPKRIDQDRSRRVDVTAARKAVSDLLVSLGVEVSEEVRRETPRRVVEALSELTTPVPFEITTFPNDEGYDQLVVARDIPFASLCEHHLLPFVGVAHVGYLPAERIVGLSKLARVVEHVARGLQVQERMSAQIANLLQLHLQPKGVGVLLEAEHLCTTLRGTRATGSTTVTSTLLGRVRSDPRTRQEFLLLAGRAGNRQRS